MLAFYIGVLSSLLYYIIKIQLFFSGGHCEFCSHFSFFPCFTIPFPSSSVDCRLL